VVQEKEVTKVGAALPTKVDVKIIAATNKSLVDMVKKELFREDLYYRLNVISFRMPPLRERKDDIPLLAQHFVHRFAQETNKSIDQISREALDEMMLYEWPGNVRELQNAIERAVVVGKGRKIMLHDLPILQPERLSSAIRKSLNEVEKLHIIQVLRETEWNISKSAQTLGIDRSTLYNKIKRYNIQKPT